tara:strand:+ start:1590 stop:2006 length:417 start_codon:yes stop_codon:yes gene_type:complete
MVTEKKPAHFFDMTILECIESQPVNKKHALLLNMTELSTKASLQKSRQAIIAAHIQHKTVILELEYKEKSASKKTLMSIMPLCHVIAGSPQAFHQASNIKNTTQALQYIREKSDAILVLKKDKQQNQIFEKEIVGEIT